MAASCDSSSSSMSPVSSPSVGYLDLYGKRRQVAKVQVLEREIGLLQEELKSLGGLELASSCCKELDNYIEATQDPLMAVNQMSSRSRNFWKFLRRKFNSLPWICCFCGCCLPSKRLVCCACYPSATSQSPGWSCLEKTCTSGPCNCAELSCPCSFSPSCPKCLTMTICSGCACCNPCLCF